jgi:hypothetical protein
MQWETPSPVHSPAYSPIRYDSPIMIKKYTPSPVKHYTPSSIVPRKNTFSPIRHYDFSPVKLAFSPPPRSYLSIPQPEEASPSDHTFIHCCALL